MIHFKRLQLIFLSFIFSFIFLSSFVLTAEISYDIDYSINALNGDVSQEVKVDNHLSKQYYWTYFNILFTPPQIYNLDWSKGCSNVIVKQEEFEREGEFAGQTLKYDYLMCDPINGKFQNGDSFSINIKGNCNCTFGWGGIIHENNKIRVYPKNFYSRINEEANVRYSIIAPVNYYVSDKSIKRLQLKESSQNIELVLESKLNGYDSVLKENELFVEFTRKFDFKKNKVLNGKYKDTNININYPTGFEDDAQDLLKEMQKILPYYESYGETTFKEITINIVGDKALSCKTDGCANPSKESINISIDTDITTLYHETCHLTEKPFSYPSWFSEGAAVNCEIATLKNFGFTEKAIEVEKQKIENSKLPVNLNLQKWRTIENIKENENETSKGYGLSFTLMKEILKSVNITEFYINYRNKKPINITLTEDQNYTGFWFNNLNSSDLDVYIDIKNSPKISILVNNNSNKEDYYLEEDASLNDPERFWLNSKKEFSYFNNVSQDYWIICTLNNISKKDLTPLFYSYNFEKIKSCQSFYDLTDIISKRAISDFNKAQELHQKKLDIFFIIGAIIILLFIALIILIIYYIIRYLKRRI